MDRNTLQAASSIINKSHYLAALTGAGVSAGSGIPAFRGRGGLWQVYDPALARIDVFREDPHRVWEMTRTLMAMVTGSEPNPAHSALAAMERVGLLKGLVTQNIDNLHRRAGSRSVIELHGTLGKLRCLTCNIDFNSADFNLKEDDPLCPHCSAVLKPGIVFFGEAVPFGALMEARLLASTADAMLIVGTSAVVNPAAELPVIAKGNRAKIIEINIEPTRLTNSITDVFIRGRAEEVLPDLLGAISPCG